MQSRLSIPGQLTQKFTALFLLVFVVLMTYLSVRAFRCALLNDEAYTYYLIKTGYWRAMAGTANTHLLNNFGMWLFPAVLGSDSEGVLRLWSLLAFPVYALGVYRLVTGYRSTAVRICVAALLLLNPYLLDYFSMARGYSWAIAFHTLGLAYFFEALKSGSENSWTKAWICMAIGLVSNYCLLNLFAVMALFYGVHRWRTGAFALPLRPEVKRQLALIILPALLAIGHLLLIRHFGDLTQGSSGSIADTYYSLLKKSSYVERRSFRTPVILVAAMVVALVALVFIARSLRKRDPWTFLLLALCVGTPLLMVLQHVVAGTPYLTDRTALVLYPSLAIFFGLALDEWTATRYETFPAAIVALALTAYLSIHFVRTANTRFYFDGKNSADIRSQLWLMNWEYARRALPKKKVYLYGSRGQFLHYYGLEKDYPFMPWGAGKIVTSGNLPFFLDSVDIAIVPRHVAGEVRGIKVLECYEVSQTCVVRRAD